LETTAPGVVSAIFAATDGYAYVPFIGNLSNLILDWETPQPNLITATAFEMGTKGVIFDKNSGEQDFNATIPTLPWRDDDSDSGYQLFISDYTMDTATDAFFRAAGLPLLIKHDYIPASSPI